MIEARGGEKNRITESKLSRSTKETDHMVSGNTKEVKTGQSKHV